MQENENLDSSPEEAPISENFWDWMTSYWHNNRDFPEDCEEALKKKADLVDGKVPSIQLPSYVDDVLEFDSFGNLPPQGEKGKIYVLTNNNDQYRWSGTEYILINPKDYLKASINLEKNNLNTVVDPGIYYQTSNAKTAGNNYPEDLAGALRIYQTVSAGRVQEYTIYSTANTYRRVTTDGSTWNAWKKVLSDADISSDNISDWKASFPTNHRLTKNSSSYAGDLLAVPGGTYSAAVSTTSNNKPFSNVGGLISFGNAVSGMSTRLLGARDNSDNLWFQSGDGTGAWRQLASRDYVNSYVNTTILKNNAWSLDDVGKQRIYVSNGSTNNDFIIKLALTGGIFNIRSNTNANVFRVTDSGAVFTSSLDLSNVLNLNNANATIRYANNDIIRSSTNNVIFSSPNSAAGALYFRPQGTSATAGQVIISSNGQISTTPHGDSSQWNQAYNWGNHSNAGYALLSGNQSFLGQNTFNLSPIVPTPILGNHAVNKNYIDNNFQLNNSKFYNATNIDDNTFTSAWITIATISDNTSSPVIFAVRAYAHSSLMFTAIKSYQNAGNITVLNYNGTANAAYRTVKGVRLLNDGSVQIRLVGNVNGAIQLTINAFSSTESVTLVNSLTVYTGSTTSINEFDNLENGKFVTKTGYKVNDGTSSQFLKADGSLDSTDYYKFRPSILSGDTNNVIANSTGPLYYLNLSNSPYPSSQDIIGSISNLGGKLYGFDFATVRLGGSRLYFRDYSNTTTPSTWFEIATREWSNSQFSLNNHIHTFATITNKPTTLSGYGITDGMSTSHPANSITTTNINNWNTAFGWGKGLKTDGTNGTVTTSSGLTMDANEVRNSSVFLNFTSTNIPDFGTTTGASIVNFTPFKSGTRDIGFSISARNGKFFFNTGDNNVWDGWKEVYHSGNIGSLNFVPQNPTRPTSADFNTYKSQGFHAIGQGLTNSPTGAGSWGNLLVTQSLTDRFMQQYFDQSSNNIYYRNGVGSNTTWGAWNKILTDVNTGWGTGMNNNEVNTTDLFNINDSRIVRYANTASNTPTNEAGNLMVLNRATNIKTRLAFTDTTKDFYFTTGSNDSSWKKVWHSGNFNPANYALDSSVLNNSYSENASLANNPVLKNHKLVPFTTANDGYIYEVNLSTVNTGTITGIKYVIVHDGTTWNAIKIGESAETSNRPSIFIDGGLPKLKTGHNNTYGIAVTVKAYYAGVSGVVDWKRFLGLTFEALQNKPTTLNGYGITDAVSTSSLNSTLSNYATLNGVQTFTNTITFDQNPTIPWATLIEHAVNLGQMNDSMEILSGKIISYVANNYMSTLHSANSITSANITNWNTSFGWGNHATAGYANESTVKESIDDIFREITNPNYTIAVKNKYITIIITEDSLLEKIDWEKFFPGQHIHVINTGATALDLNLQGNTFDKILEKETSEYYINSDTKIIKKGTYTSARFLS